MGCLENNFMGATKLQETIRAIINAKLSPAALKAVGAQTKKTAEATVRVLKHANSLVNNTVREKARADRLANQIIWTYKN